MRGGFAVCNLRLLGESWQNSILWLLSLVQERFTPTPGMPSGMGVNNTMLISRFPKMEHHTHSINEKKKSILFAFQTFDFSNRFFKNVFNNNVWTASILQKLSPIRNLYTHFRVTKLVCN